ncbi:zinc finger protein 567 [Anabrus simplex]|uniref:zinc finger protein 567 n=1 Tax=Anabrus simplex TaxID=316456 RepID=UPI0035A2E903
MDVEVKIKEEPTWLEGTLSASLENIEHVSEMIPLKKEAKSELTEPGPTQENSFEPSKNIKKEIFIEQNADDQLLAYIKEETHASSLEVINNPSTFQPLQLQCEMDVEVKIKEEPTWLEGTLSASLENIEHVSEMIPLKKEAKSELTEPGPTQEISFEPSKDIKKEIVIEPNTDNQLLAYIKEETQSRPEVTCADHESQDGRGPCFRCKICFKSFTRKASLTNHIVIHTGERPHCCNVCDKSFSLKTTLRNHSRIHTGDKPYWCNVCGKSFIHRNKLRNHIVIHTGERPHCCNVCDKSFSLKSTLTNHLRIHTVKRRHWCNVCFKSFIRKASLTRHMQTHTGERPFCCVHCGKSFNCKGTLTDHMLTHTGEKPHSCIVCGKFYRHKVALKVHMRTHIPALSVANSSPRTSI